MNDTLSIEKGEKTECLGAFCNLIKVLDPELDLVTNESKGLKGKHFKKQNSCKNLGRERAYKVLRRILTKDELDDLEDNAYITHLSIVDRIRPSMHRLVPRKCIDATHQECRISLLQLEDAEGVIRGTSGVEGGTENDEIHFLRKSAQLVNDSSSRINVTVCEMCYHTYRLLSQSRCLQDKKFRRDALGQAQDSAFGLTELMNSIRISKHENLTEGGFEDKITHGYCHSACQVAKVDSEKKGVDYSCSSNNKTDENLKLGQRKMRRHNHGQIRGNSKKLDLQKNKSRMRPRHYQWEIRDDSKNADLLGTKRRMQSQMSEPSIFSFDECTVIPYTILGKGRDSHDQRMKSAGAKMKYNLIVCHDLFETYERMKILLLPFVKRHSGHKILLWNYPGQAYTSFSATQHLNNEFHAKCLEKLLLHVGADGTKEFDACEPFYLMGYGYGGSVACLYAKLCPLPALRAIFLVNPLSYVDTHFASVIHDCRNVFRCSPASRPDLPLYFYSRFLFSDEYLQNTSTSFALNLYTAVHNPITSEGRVQLCDGVLNNLDLREVVKDISPPIISLYGDEASLIRPLHADSFVKDRHCCQTVHQALCRKYKNTLLIAIHGGHELLQEGRKSLISLLEQLLLGFHEINEVPLKYGKVIVNNATDAFQLASNSPQMKVPPEAYISPLTAIDKMHRKGRECLARGNRCLKTDISSIMLDPENPVFERQNNTIYKPQVGSNIYPLQVENRNAREYMSWRLRRNRKRLSRFQRAARVIQNTLRIYMAKTMIARLKREGASRTIQRVYRGSRGRLIFKGKLKELWAAHLVQRTYRGSMGRKTSYYKRITNISQVTIARFWRGFVARRLVQEKIAFRNTAATTFQTLWRRFMAMQVVGKLKLKRNSAVTIQRIYRGFKGRILAECEKERYVFSRSQSRGIELGRQMLAEHKIHVSRLQSELNTIAQEKKTKETKMKHIANEIGTFQDRVDILEKSMHNLSAVEVEQKASIYTSSSRGTTDIALREKKVKLDEEFSALLTKISDRKNQLKSVEMALVAIENRKKETEGSLKLRERMLLALLESQENEIQTIHRRQTENVDIVVRPLRNKDMHPTSGTMTAQMEKSAGSDYNSENINQLMHSTETMMKFGFLSMSMTHFTSMNMIRAMKSASSKDFNSLNQLNAKIVSNTPKNAPQTNKEELNIFNAEQPKTAISKWEVDHVIRWLKALSLGQYEKAFRDGSVDGPFLCHLTDDDLVNIIGIEHKLHRKKIRLGIAELMQKSGVFETRNSNELKIEDVQTSGNNINGSRLSSVTPSSVQQSIETEFLDTTTQADEYGVDKFLSLEDLSRWVRGQKYSLIKDALTHIPPKDFDSISVQVPYMDGLGTLYEKSISDEPFHINKSDEHGNTLLHIAAQNGNLRIAKLLIEKGANPNHQNIQGQTPGHFAVAYQFYEFASWLYDEDGGNGNDLITNIWGLGPYDGLNPE